MSTIKNADRNYKGSQAQRWIVPQGRLSTESCHRHAILWHLIHVTNVFYSKWLQGKCQRLDK
ncbi:protein PLASTID TRANSCRIPTIONALLY ACTIVE 12 [Iris pallida]|uniref:Protein PLASTID TRANSCRIPTIONALLY ACTIVE 12 n=1 Tax=Iris pallida TaxID=29817 RepID=A0AAX6GS50_IRIPA|nr:protein PLASTID TRANSCRIPTIONALLY ACTIVE 12 [Iris pallida]